MPASSVAINIFSMLAVVKELLHLVIHCVYFENFYVAVEEAGIACIQRMKNRNCTSKLDILLRRSIFYYSR